MENPFKNQALKLRRTAKLTQILVKYGFQDLLGSQSNRPSMEGVPLPPNDPTVYERIRLAIEELGPTFVKFGQTLSDRKSTRLNSSHVKISYAVFCLKKKKQ